MFNRKKQRRQVAAGVVQSMMGGSSSNPTSSSGRKSTAQPRPDIVVPPGGIGPIANPNENDVLCGRGGRINSHAGNRQFREIIQSRKKEYLAPTTKKLEKAHIAAAIVNDIRSMQPAGRFLKEDGKSGMWYDIGDAKAIKKTGQALREDAPEIRPAIDNAADQSKSPDKSPKNGSASKQKKSKSIIPKTVNATSNRNNAGTAHGPQLLPSEAQQQRNGVDPQGRAAMPPPFQIHQQANPYLQPAAEQQQQPLGSSFEARSIPIQAPQNVSADYLNDVQQQQALFMSTREENAFGRPFHPPGSALGSEGTMSTISGLTDPVRSAVSGSGMNGSTARSPPRLGNRVTSRGSSGVHSFSARFSDMSSNNMMSVGGLGDMSMAGSSLARSSSFQDMSSVLGSDSWNKGMMDSDSDLAQLRSVLSGGTSRTNHYGTGGSSLMSITSGTSSNNPWMANAASADFDVRSMNMSDMSSGLNALDLA